MLSFLLGFQGHSQLLGDCTKSSMVVWRTCNLPLLVGDADYPPDPIIRHDRNAEKPPPFWIWNRVNVFSKSMRFNQVRIGCQLICIGACNQTNCLTVLGNPSCLANT